MSVSRLTKMGLALVIASIVPVSGALDATATKPVVDEGWVPVRSVEGAGFQAVRFRDVPEYYERISALLAKMPNWKRCTSITASPCDTAPSIEFSAVLQPCSTPTQLDCIVEFGTVNAQNVREAATYTKAFPSKAVNGYPAEPSLGLPAGGPGGLWTVATSSGLTVRSHYVSAVVRGTTTPGKKVTFTNFSAMVAPIEVTTFTCDGTTDEISECSPAYVPNPPEDIQFAGFDGYVDGNGRDRGLDCVMTGNLNPATKVAECALRKSVSREITYYMSVRLSQAVTGWLHGRMADPDITIEDISGVDGAIAMSVAARAVSVPVVDVERKFSDLPAALQETYRKSGGWNGSGAAGYGNAAFETDPARRNRESRPTPYGADSIAELEAWIPVVSDTAIADVSTWTVRTLGPEDLGAAKGCITTRNKVAGIVTTNGTVYKAAAPAYDKTTQSLNYTVSAPHYMSSGELFKGSYSLIIRSDVARCVYNFSSAPIKSTIQVLDTEAAPSAVVTNVSEKDGWLRMSATGFTHSSPTIRATLSQEEAAASSGATGASQRRVTTGRSASRATLLKWAGLRATSKSKVTYAVTSSSRSVCRVSGTSVRAVRKGTCSVVVRVRTGARLVSKTVKFTVG